MTTKPLFLSAIVAIGILLSGCASQRPDAVLSEPAEPDPATAQPDYWLRQPAAATVFGYNYDQLWSACSQTARADLFDLDRQDYRDGLLTTRPLVSRQFFEFWRPDTGDCYGVMQNSLQTIRRTIQFHFEKVADGYTVSPKVLIERLSRQSRQITSTAEFRNALDKPVGGENKGDYWYATGRDLAMEAELAVAIKSRVNPG